MFLSVNKKIIIFLFAIIFFLFSTEKIFSQNYLKDIALDKKEILQNKFGNISNPITIGWRIAALKVGGEDTAHGGLPGLVSPPTRNILKCTRKFLNGLSPDKSAYLIDSFKTYPYNKKRVRLVTAANIVGYGGTLIGLNVIWYSKYPRSGFHFFNDNSEWQQVDKVGHVYSAYTESRATMEAWRWAGLSRKKSIWIGGLSGVAYQSIIEVLDGFSSEYGFSIGDFAANVIGSATFISQELAWNEQKIKLKFSFHKKNYGQPDLDTRADQLYGKTEIERFIKDYNGQSYWISANIQSFFPETKLPRWLSVSVGYGAEGMFGGTKNIGYDKNGNIIFDRTDISRYRQWYLAPDVDFTKIRTNKKGIKILLFVLNSFKFPAPTLEYSNGSLKGHWILF